MRGVEPDVIDTARELELATEGEVLERKEPVGKKFYEVTINTKDGKSVALILKKKHLRSVKEMIWKQKWAGIDVTDRRNGMKYRFAEDSIISCSWRKAETKRVVVGWDQFGGVYKEVPW